MKWISKLKQLARGLPWKLSLTFLSSLGFMLVVAWITAFLLILIFNYNIFHRLYLRWQKKLPQQVIQLPEENLGRSSSP